jgi:hypothetical protein
MTASVSSRLPKVNPREPPLPLDATLFDGNALQKKVTARPFIPRTCASPAAVLARGAPQVASNLLGTAVPEGGFQKLGGLVSQAFLTMIVRGFIAEFLSGAKAKEEAGQPGRRA